MKLNSKSLVAIAVFFAAAAALLYGEMVLDWRTRHIERNMKMALTSSSSFLMADYNQLQEEMKRKYGSEVSVSVPISMSPADKNGVAEVSVKGSVVETHSLKRLSNISGLFLFNPDDAAPVRFPFRIEPDQNLTILDRSLASSLADHFKRAPASWFAFDDADWGIGPCQSIKSGLGLGMIGDVLRLREGTSCVITWKSNPSISMLVFVGRADGKWWLRPFTERACRYLIKTQVDNINLGSNSRLNYAACMFGDRATSDARGPIFGVVYEFALDGRLDRLAKIGKN